MDIGAAQAVGQQSGGGHEGGAPSHWLNLSGGKQGEGGQPDRSGDREGRAPADDRPRNRNR